MGSTKQKIYFEALDPNPPMIDLMRDLKGAGYRMAFEAGPRVSSP